MSAVTVFLLPTAEITISASFTSFFSSLVLEWHIVTVAFFESMHKAIGLPTILLLPMIATFCPSIFILYFSSIVTIPRGVQGIKPSCPMHKFPTFCGLKPSTSFSGLILLNAF